MKKYLLLVAVLCSACNVLPEREPVALYRLPPPLLENSATGPLLSALRIDRPVTSEALAGNRLLILTGDNQFQAFAGMRLAAPVPLLWRDWLVDAFWRDGRTAGLSVASQGLRAPLELGGVLRSFHVDLTGAQPAAVIEFDATLIDTVNRQIVASRRFETRRVMAVVEESAAVTALGLAASQLVVELIDWVVGQEERLLPGPDKD